MTLFSFFWLAHRSANPTGLVSETPDPLLSRTTDMVLFLLVNPRWEQVFQPKDAASLNPIELGWKILRSH
ncbi:hypothetical protein [Microvirga soli]|uniref:hypothetical protein n=1 Tax=Microvirga soli TaxID=1854496 RepID=UPI00191F2805|nr:hypothetical protein [Microvirga soli]